jgi:tetratricopeptide (TPR) repeat protein
MKRLQFTPLCSSMVTAGRVTTFALTALILAGAAPADAPPSGAGTAPPSEAQRLFKAGNYVEAETKARQRLAEVESESGAQSLQVAQALDDLTEALWRLGKGADPDARAVAARAVAIKEALFGADDPRVAASLRGLAILVNQNGDYDEALALFERGRHINEQAFGPQSLEVGVSLDNIASVLRHQGDYAGARPLVEKSLEIKRRLQGDTSPGVASTMMNLGTTLAMMGDYDGARPLMEGALTIQEKTLPPDHPVLLLSLDNLGELMMLAGDFESARPLEERALKLRLEKLGPVHMHVALSFQNMGELELHTGHPAEAIDYLTRSLQVREKVYGPDHPMVAQSLDTRGEALLQTGDPEGARADFERALRIETQTLDARHPDRARSVLGLGRSALALGDRTAAFDRGLEAERLVREHFQAAAQGLSENDALRYAKEGAGGLDVALSVLATARKGATSVQSATLAWDQVVRSRAMVLDEMAARHRYVANQANPEVVRLARSLNAARTRLAGLLGRLPQSGALDDYRKQIDRTYEEKESAERALAAASATFRVQRTRSRAGLDEVLRNLPAQAALLAFVRFDRQGPSSSKPPVPAYAAFVFREGMKGPLALSLGPAAEIDGLVDSWQREVGVDPRGAGDVAGAMNRYRAAGDSLRRKIWDPLLPHLEHASLVLVVPDGSLNLVNFETLPIAGDRFLLEDGLVVHYLSSERDLVPVSPAAEAKPGLLAVGAVDYDATATKVASAAPHDDAIPDSARGSEESPGPKSYYRSPESVCAGLNSLRFAPLPATANEIEDIAAAAQSAQAGGDAGVRKLLGSEADEATFKAHAERFGSLHLATHAFFANQSCEGPPALPTGGKGSRGAGQATKPGLQALQDPLLLTGLALAGANRRASAPSGGDGEDGLLTAEEIASLDLSGAHWAVLSACRTGVGAIRDGEGVLGLRRAFDIAGAGTLIMSLWQVEDEATSAWMKALYQARAAKLSTADSVRKASLDLLAAQRRAGRSTHPFYWGAFIAAGDWR